MDILSFVPAYMDAHAHMQQLEIVVKKRQCPHQRVHFEASLTDIWRRRLSDKTLSQLKEKKDLFLRHNWLGDLV